MAADVCQLNNKNDLCIVDYHSKFPVEKKMEGYQQTAEYEHKKLYLQSMAYPKG